MEERMRTAHDSTKGLHFGKTPRCRDTHELISYSEWATEADIKTYLDSAAHKEMCTTRVV